MRVADTGRQRVVGAHPPPQWLLWLRQLGQLEQPGRLPLRLRLRARLLLRERLRRQSRVRLPPLALRVASL